MFITCSIIAALASHPITLWKRPYRFSVLNKNRIVSLVADVDPFFFTGSDFLQRSEPTDEIYYNRDQSINYFHPFSERSLCNGLLLI